MASFTLGPDPRFHVGVTVYCYRGGGLVPISVTPVTSGVVSVASTTTFADLDDGTSYLAGLSVAGPFVSFKTPEADEVPASATAVAVVLYDPDDGWGPRQDAALNIFSGGDVSTPPTVGGEFGALPDVDWWVPATGEGA